MKRRLFTLLAAASLLLGITTVPLWVVSYWWIFTITKFRHTTREAPREERVGKIGAFTLTLMRGRCEVDIEMDSAYIDDDGKWHVTHESAFPGIGDIEVQAPMGFTLFQPAERLPIYRVYFNRAAFAFYRNDLNDIYRDYAAIFPLWSSAVLLSALPALWARSWMRSRKEVRSGLCRSCGYDLRSSPDRCPECGTPARAAGKTTIG